MAAPEKLRNGIRIKLKIKLLKNKTKKESDCIKGFPICPKSWKHTKYPLVNKKNNAKIKRGGTPGI